VKYLLIILVIAAALAPLAHFVPSKRQRQIARLREFAAVHGLFVEFREIPGAGLPGVRRADDDSAAPGGQVIYYGRRWPPSLRERPARVAWLRLGEQWRAVTGGGPAPAALGGLPQVVLAASVDEESCGVYWREAGGEEAVAQIVRALQAWVEAH
jgi:hypothetical protein